MEISIGIVIALGAFSAGYILGAWAEGMYWHRKGLETSPKTCVAHKGRFFYVVPEREYVEKILGIER